MAIDRKDIEQLKLIIKIAEGLLEKASEPGNTVPKGGVETRTRRVGKDLATFRKLLKAERKRGVSVAELARQHGVTPSYIYQLA
jgi:hypothetical protein